MTVTEHDAGLATYELFVDGDWVAPLEGRTSERTSPADGSVVTRYAAGTAADVETAVAAARACFDDSPWPTSPARSRAALLQRAAGLLRERADTIGRRITLELGKPITLARNEVLLTADVFDYYAALAQDLRGDVLSQHNPDALGLVVREPVGVVAMITPWNFPLLLLAWKVAPAIAAGCTMITKPSSLTPGAALELASVFADAELPNGVYNVVTGGGREVGMALAKHHGVDKVAFTGSTEVGREILTAATGNIKKVTLELGGKSPNVVFADADLKQAIRGAYWGIFLNNGQACQAGSRLLVQREAHDELVAGLLEMTRTSRVGDPLDEKTLIGPVVDEEQLGTVLRYIETGTGEGAELVHGGNRIQTGALADGLFVEPTVFDGVGPEMAVGREEIFGPVLSILTFEDAADAVRLANDSMYGLAAAVWTKNIDVALRTAKAIRAGTVWVNAYHDAGLAFVMPFGGYKASGFGRELGRDGLNEYMETKAIHVRLGKLSSPSTDPTRVVPGLDPGDLTIERIEVTPVRAPLGRRFQGSHYSMTTRCTIVTRITTSCGIVGEAYNGDTDEEQARIVAIVNDELAPLVTGLSALRTEACWEAMLPATYDILRDRSLALQAIACVDTAIWDAVGKALGVPLYQLWGGYRDRLPAICIGGYYSDDEADLERQIARYVELGFGGCKFKVGRLSPAADAERTRRARAAAGADFVLMADANQGYTRAQAIEYARLTADVGLRWFEEPCGWLDDRLSMRDVRLAAGIPVAAGQSEQSRPGVRDLLAAGAIDACNCDASWIGGPTEWRRLASVAAAYQVEMAHHEEPQVSAHLLASIPHGTYLETFDPERDPIFWNMIANRREFENGEYLVPDGPGLGLELDQDYIDRYRAE